MTHLYILDSYVLDYNAAAERPNGAIPGDNRNGATSSESPPEDTRETVSVDTLNDVATSEAHDGDSMSLPSHLSHSGGSPTPRYSDTNLSADDDSRNGHSITPHEREQLNLRIVIKGAPNARRNRGSSPNLRRRPMPSKTDTRRGASSQD